MSISQTEGYFENGRFLEEPVLFLLAFKWNLQEKACSCVKTKSNLNFPVNLDEMLKEATIYFSLQDESHFSKHLFYLICDNGIYRI